MRVIVNDENGNAIKETNPLPVSFGYNSSDGFGETITSPNATTATQVKAATSGKSIYVTDLIISVQDETEVRLQDSDGTVVVQTLYLPDTSVFSKSFSTALPITASKALNVVTSVATPISVTITGFVI